MFSSTNTTINAPSRYSRIREFIQKMLGLRDGRDGPTTDSPSEYWVLFNKISGYVQHLTDNDLDLVRYHTWHLTADNYQTYFFGTQPDELLAEYNSLTSELGGFTPCEPDNGIGWPTVYGLISYDLLRYLRVLYDLSVNKVISQHGHTKIVEIGGGYGGLAWLALNYNPEISYVIVDLEEILFFSAVYLVQHLGENNVDLLSPVNTDTLTLLPGKCYLLPQQGKHLLLTTQFDVAINQQSMQEMYIKQVEEYCNILAKCSRVLYSCNRDQHSAAIVGKTRIIQQLNDYLTSRFKLKWDSHALVLPPTSGCFKQQDTDQPPDSQRSWLGCLMGHWFKSSKIKKPSLLSLNEQKMPVPPSFVQLATDYTLRRMILECRAGESSVQ